MRMSALDIVSYVLVVVGGLNWGLVGWFKYNLVDEIFGVGSGAARVVYALVGVAAIYMLFSFSRLSGQSR